MSISKSKYLKNLLVLVSIAYTPAAWPRLAEEIKGKLLCQANLTSTDWKLGDQSLPAGVPSRYIDFFINNYLVGKIPRTSEGRSNTYLELRLGPITTSPYTQENQVGQLQVPQVIPDRYQLSLVRGVGVDDHNEVSASWRTELPYGHIVSNFGGLPSDQFTEDLSQIIARVTGDQAYSSPTALTRMTYFWEYERLLGQRSGGIVVNTLALPGDITAEQVVQIIAEWQALYLTEPQDL